MHPQGDLARLLIACMSCGVATWPRGRISLTDKPVAGEERSTDLFAKNARLGNNDRMRG
jgi:hypothetical protein